MRSWCFICGSPHSGPGFACSEECLEAFGKVVIGQLLRGDRGPSFGNVVVGQLLRGYRGP